LLANADSGWISLFRRRIGRFFCDLVLVVAEIAEKKCTFLKRFIMKGCTISPQREFAYSDAKEAFFARNAACAS